MELEQMIGGVLGAVGVQAVKSLFEAATGRRKCTQKDHTALAAELHETQKKQAENVAKIRSLENQITLLEKQRRDLQEQLDGTSAALAGSLEQIKELRDEVETLRSERDELASVVDALSIQLEGVGQVPSQKPRPRNGKGQFSK